MHAHRNAHVYYSRLYISFMFFRKLSREGNGFWKIKYNRKPTVEAKKRISFLKHSGYPRIIHFLTAFIFAGTEMKYIAFIYQLKYPSSIHQ